MSEYVTWRGDDVEMSRKMSPKRDTDELKSHREGSTWEKIGRANDGVFYSGFEYRRKIDPNRWIAIKGDEDRALFEKYHRTISVLLTDDPDRASRDYSSAWTGIFSYSGATHGSSGRKPTHYIPILAEAEPLPDPDREAFEEWAESEGLYMMTQPVKDHARKAWSAALEYARK